MGFFLLPVSLVAQTHLVYPGGKGPGQGKHIVFIAGDEEYRSEEGLPQMAKILSQQHGFKCTVLFPAEADGTINPDNGHLLPGAEALDTADVIFMLNRFRSWTDEEMKHFVDAYLAGKSIIALRTSTHAFSYPKDSKSPYAKFSWDNKEWAGGFGRQVLGETWVAHHGAHKSEATRGIIEPSAKDSPLLHGVKDVFGDTDVYTANPPADVQIILRGAVLKGMNPNDPPVEGPKNTPMQPVAWTRLYKNEAGKQNRIFCTTMGAATDLLNEDLRRLLINATYWGAGLESKIPARAEAALVGDYQPSKYGFGGYKKGVKVSEHSLVKKTSSTTLPLVIHSNERIAFTGGSLAERMSIFGHFESLLHSRFPQEELVVRNFGWPADEVATQQRPADYTRIDDPFKMFGPDMLLCFFGFNESYAGPAGVDKFKSDYEAYMDRMNEKYASKSLKLRFVLVSPIAFEVTTNKFQPDGITENQNLKTYTEAVRAVAEKRGLAFVDLYTPTLAAFGKEKGAQYTINGIHLNEAGDRFVGEILDRELFRSPNPFVAGAKGKKLHAAVNDKSWVHSQDYRMLNGWYVYGSRSSPYDTDTFPAEYKKVRLMAAVRDRYVWDIAQGKQVSETPDDSKTGELKVPKTAFGTKTYSEPKELKFLSPDESVKAMKVADGFDVSLFASEAQFPELAKPVQLSFDNKGRLWVACMPTYPQWKPGDARPNDKILILEDTDGDGKADKCKVFYDKLHCPVGFEFWNGGILVTSQPRMLFLKDTDGDDVADQVVEFSDGWATDDTHHAISAYEYNNGGVLHFLEGISMSTTVETVWGPLRRHNVGGAYQMDLISGRTRAFMLPGQYNMWCYVFDQWGQGIVGDGTTAQQNWDSPLSGNQVGTRRSLRTVFDNGGMRPALGSEFLMSRHFPDSVQGQFVYACVINMNGMPRFTVGDDGAGFSGKKIEDFISSTDRNFRPGDPQIGPDGALWFIDWHNPLVGHMQYSQRDPNRDHVHGRVYRITAKGRPLLKPVTQYGKSIAQLLEQLKEYEPRTRYRARMELRDRPTPAVVAGVKKWVAGLSETDPKHDLLLCEAMWVLQGHHALDNDLLTKVLTAKTFQARAAATHTLSEDWPYITEPMKLLGPQITDAHPRVRLEAVRALSFQQTPESLELALKVASQPLDYWVDYTLQHTLSALEVVWKPLLAKEDFSKDNTVGRDYLRAMASGRPDLGMAAISLKTLLNETNIKPEDRAKLYTSVGSAKGRVENGKQIFERVCVACHKIGDKGADFGPELTHVASRLKKVDVIESVLYPNEKVEAKYLTVNITTKTGDEISGVIDSETADTVVMKLGAGQIQAVMKSNIAKREQMKVSSMPEGLGNTLAPEEFVDLIEYVAGQK